jgi:hypothetical protein
MTTTKNVAIARSTASAANPKTRRTSSGDLPDVSKVIPDEPDDEKDHECAKFHVR